MSYKAEVIADSSGKWVSNGLRFETVGEAEIYAEDLAMRWTLVRDYRATECNDEVTHILITGNLGRTLKRLGDE